jgi:hypothetical protein
MKSKTKTSLKPKGLMRGPMPDNSTTKAGMKPKQGKNLKALKPKRG